MLGLMPKKTSTRKSKQIRDTDGVREACSFLLVPLDFSPADESSVSRMIFYPLYKSLF